MHDAVVERVEQHPVQIGPAHADRRRVQFALDLLHRPAGDLEPARGPEIGLVDHRPAAAERGHLVAQTEPLHAAHAVVPEVDAAARLESLAIRRARS